MISVNHKKMMTTLTYSGKG